MKIGMVAGEASGDLLGAALIRALARYYPHVEIEGIGGVAMQQAGCRSLFAMEPLSVMGFYEPLRRLPQLLSMHRALANHFITHKPALFIGIDAPDFNLSLEKKLRRAGIPIIHYVSPSVWAWRHYRIRQIANQVHLMLTLFPFEAAFYRAHRVPVCYVGHPLARHIPLVPDVSAARSALALSASYTYLTLLPGSRHQEIKHLAIPLLLAAKKIYAQLPQARFLTSFVTESAYQLFRAYQLKWAPEIPLHCFINRSHDVIAAADVVMVKSGTATLEAMLFKKPMIIVYRTSPATYWLAKQLVHTRYIGLPNLLANKLLVPELIQKAVTAEAITQAVMYYLSHPAQCALLREQFTILHEQLYGDDEREMINKISLYCN